MGSEGPRPGPGHDPQDEPVCEACGRPVGTAIRRRKVLGVFVPEWGPGPCRNAQCEACVTDEDGEHSGDHPENRDRAMGRHRRPRHRRPHPGAVGGPTPTPKHDAQRDPEVPPSPLA
ncbi:hypothetical protein [Streptomyces alfalfae]|uniref:Uncharacterized protein n=1 Tax=Streptomyces alfalfae TaxID=1642299 RepID=A0A7T4U2G8_9ACTN|nr:hypothetical protein [Streptomyces alfalfae]QQC94265.1 hypothetical protein I8755_25165 [Streptomyces alfalfae]